MKKTFLPTAITIASLMITNLSFATPAVPRSAVPPLPITPTPSTTLVVPAGIAQDNPLPPIPGKMRTQVEQARARQAMEAALAKYLRYWGPRYQVAPVEVTVEGEWAHGVAKWQGQAKTLNGPIHILAHRLPDGTWEALLPGADGVYLQWLEAMPEHLVPASEKSQLRAQAAEAEALRRPQAMPTVLPAANVIPPSKKEASKTVGPVLGLVQPTATPTPQVQRPAVGAQQEGRWATYTDRIFGYSFEYPSSWVVKPHTLSGSLSSVAFLAEREQESLIVYIDADWQGKTKEPINFSLAGIPGIRRSIRGGQNPPQELVIFEKDGRVYTIQFIYDNDEDLNIFEHILSSFYFLEAPLQKGAALIGGIQTEVGILSTFPQCPAQNKPGWPTWGTVIVPAGNWGGVNVYSNGGDVNNACWDTFGYKYQCVELVQRLYAQKWGYPNIWTGVGCASQMMENHPSDIVAIWNGNSPPPRWGDALVFGSPDGCGHVAVVTRVEGGRVYFVEQNWSMWGEDSLRIDSGNHIENRGTYWVRGWLHSPRNSGGGSCDATNVPSGYSKCAEEGERCNFSGTQQVYYGANNCYKVKSFTNGVDCNNNNFGDPLPGVHKACYVSNPSSGCDATSLPSGYVKCADENGYCSFSGTQQVYYGADSCYKVKTFTDGVACNNNNFGDPLPGVGKACYVPPSCNPNANQIALYANTGYGGSCVTLGVGDYPNPGYLGSLGNDNAESIRVGSNVQAILYEHDNYQGRSETFTSNDSNLGDNYIGANSVSSVKVQWRAQPPAAPALQSPPNGAVFNEGQGINLSWSATGNEYYGEVWGGPASTLTFGWQSGTSKDIGPQWAG